MRKRNLLLCGKRSRLIQNVVIFAKDGKKCSDIYNART